MTKEFYLVIKYFSHKTCLFVDSLLTYLELFIVCSSGSIGLLFWHLPRGHELYSANRTACLENAKSQLYVGQNPPARNNCFCSLRFFSPSKVMFVFLLFFLLRIMIYYDCEKPSCPWSKCTTCERNEHSWQVDSRTFHATALLRRSICRDHYGFRRYLYCKGNEQTTSRLG